MLSFGRELMSKQRSSYHSYVYSTLHRTHCPHFHDFHQSKIAAHPTKFHPLTHLWLLINWSPSIGRLFNVNRKNLIEIVAITLPDSWAHVTFDILWIFPHWSNTIFEEWIIYTGHQLGRRFNVIGKAPKVLYRFHRMDSVLQWNVNFSYNLNQLFI